MPESSQGDRLPVRDTDAGFDPPRRRRSASPSDDVRDVRSTPGGCRGRPRTLGSPELTLRVTRTGFETAWHGIAYEVPAGESRRNLCIPNMVRLGDGSPWLSCPVGIHRE